MSFRDDAHFLSWLRSALRGRVWKHHPAKYKAMAKYKQCAWCGSKKKLQVDHITPNPPLTIDTIKEYVLNLLYVDETALQRLCKECHDVKTHAERNKISIEQARWEKEVLKNTKYAKDTQEFCKKHGVEYTNRPDSIERLRRLKDG